VLSRWLMPSRFVDPLGLRSKGERVTRVLSQHTPTAGAFCVSCKVLLHHA
jgi:hypothetical protein